MWTIKRLNDTEYFVTTDIVLADGESVKRDTCELVGTELKGVKGFRIGYPLRVKLGPETLANVKALAIGETFTATRKA